MIQETETFDPLIVLIDNIEQIQDFIINNETIIPTKVLEMAIDIILKFHKAYEFSYNPLPSEDHQLIYELLQSLESFSLSIIKLNKEALLDPEHPNPKLHPNITITSNAYFSQLLSELKQYED